MAAPESRDWVVLEEHCWALQVPGWDPLLDDIKLENAWVFAKDDSIPGAVKAFLDFEKRLLEPIPKPDRIKVKLTDIPGMLFNVPSIF